MKVEQVLELVKAVSESNLTEFKYEEDGVKLSLKKTSDKIVQVQAPAPALTSLRVFRERFRRLCRLQHLKRLSRERLRVQRQKVEKQSMRRQAEL